MNRVVLGGGALGMVLLTALQFFDPVPPDDLQIGLLLTSIGALAFGVGWRLRIPPRRTLLVLGTITVFGLGVRAWNLGNMFHFLVDEMNTIGVVLPMRDDNVRILTRMNTVQPYTWFYTYGQVTSVALLGRDLAGLRGISVVVGAAGIPALYFQAYTLTEARRVAVFAALALAAFPLHIHFSRLSLLSIADPLMGTLMLAFLVRALKTQHHTDYALAGLFLGLTHYFFEGGRLFFTPFVLLVFLWGWWSGYRASWRGILWLGGMFAVVVLPMYFIWTFETMPTASRLGTSGYNQDYWLALLLGRMPLDAHVLRFFRGFLTYFTIPDSRWFYGGNQPLVPYVAVPFLLGGIGIALSRFRHVVCLPLLWWAGVAAANGLLILDPNGAARHLVAAPAVAFLIALCVDRLAQRTNTFATAIMIVLALLQVGYYFGPHADTFRELHYGRQAGLDDALFRAAELSPNTNVTIITDTINDPTYAVLFLLFLTDTPPDVTTVRQSQFDPASVRELPPGDYAFFVRATNPETIGALQTRFGDVPPTFSPYNLPIEAQYALFEVTAHE